MFQCPHYGKKFSSGHAIIPLCLLLFREADQRFYDIGETGNKSPVVRAWAQKASKFVLIL
jgi:hypothetical protein